MKLKDNGVLEEIKTFRKELKSYKRLLWLEELTAAQKIYKDRLRDKLISKMGQYRDTIIKLTGRQYFRQFGQEYDMWADSLNIHAYLPHQKVSLDYCIDAVIEAIGKLESSPLAEIKSQDVSVIEPPKAFIAHGGRSGILDKLREFIEALGIKPVIVELSPTRGMTVDEKVNKYIKDADCGIVLATKGGIVDTTGTKPKQHPRLNVIDELERLRAAFPEKTILLVERGVDLPSNISGLTYEPFVGQSMDRAFTAIARELTEFGILKAVKP